MFNIKKLGAVALLSLGGLSFATDANAHPKMQKLKAEIEELKAKIEKIHSDNKEVHHKVDSLESKNYEIDLSEGIMIKAKNSDAFLKLTGLLQLDYYNIFHNYEEGFGFKLSNAYNTGVSYLYRQNDSGVQLRRFKLRAQGLLSENLEYKIGLAKTSGGDIKLDDAYIAYTAFDKVVFKLGQFKYLFGLDGLTSEANLLNHERNLARTFLVNKERRAGVAATYFNKNMTASLGYHKDHLNDSNDAIDYLSNLRLTLSPYNKEGVILHVGYNKLYQDYKAKGSEDLKYLGTNILGKFDEAIFGLYDTTLAATKSLGHGIGYLDNAKTDSIELALNYKGLMVQGEYFKSSIEGNKATAAIYNNIVSPLEEGAGFNMEGYYVQASYVFGAKDREYDYKKGIFKSIEPLNNVSLQGKDMSKMGALEFGVRYEKITVATNSQSTQEFIANNSSLSESQYQDSITRTTLSSNWHLNKNAKLSLYYISSQYDHGINYVTDAGLAGYPSTIGETTPIRDNAVLVRAQFKF